MTQELAVLPEEQPTIDSPYFGHLTRDEIGAEITERAEKFWDVGTQAPPVPPSPCGR